MASVTQIENVEVKGETTLSDCEEKLCMDDSLKEFTSKSPKCNVKKELGELKGPINNTIVEDIIMPIITKIESARDKSGSMLHVYEDNVTEEEYCEKLAEEKSPAIRDTDIPCITTLEQVEVKDESSLSVYDDNIIIEECCMEQPIESSTKTSKHKPNRKKQTKQEKAKRLGLRIQVPSNTVSRSVRVRKHYTHLVELTDTASTPHSEDDEEYFKSNIDSNGNSRTNPTSYICDECNRSFNNKIQLIRHIRDHSKETIYKCNVCSKCFSRRRNLETHYHIHTGDKPYKCDVCNKCFRQKNYLNTHLRIHSGIKPHKCDICMKSFSQKTHLNVHYRIHSGVKPYKCEICLKCFNDRVNLNKHIRLHTGVKPHKCDVCMKSFNDKSDFNKHNRTHAVDVIHVTEDLKIGTV